MTAASIVRPRQAGIALVALLLAGCQVLPPHGTTPPRQGISDYERMEQPAGTPRYTLSPAQSWTPPVLTHHRPPAYPAVLVTMHLPPVNVVARLSVDTTGRVDAVYIQPDAQHPERPADFADAVRDATAAWHFTPMIFKQIRGDGRQPGSVVETAKPFSLWYRFHFEVVDGQAIVSHARASGKP